MLWSSFEFKIQADILYFQPTSGAICDNKRCTLVNLILKDHSIIKFHRQKNNILFETGYTELWVHGMILRNLEWSLEHNRSAETWGVQI